MSRRLMNLGSWFLMLHNTSKLNIHYYNGTKWLASQTLKVIEPTLTTKLNLTLITSESFEVHDSIKLGMIDIH